MARRLGRGNSSVGSRAAGQREQRTRGFRSGDRGGESADGVGRCRAHRLSAGSLRHLEPHLSHDARGARGRTDPPPCGKSTTGRRAGGGGPQAQAALAGALQGAGGRELNTPEASAANQQRNKEGLAGGPRGTGSSSSVDTRAGLPERTHAGQSLGGGRPQGAPFSALRGVRLGAEAAQARLGSALPVQRACALRHFALSRITGRDTDARLAGIVRVAALPNKVR